MAEYLPPGMSPEQNRRRALLQRMAIMGAKLLPNLVVRDLHSLVLLEDYTPFSQEEKRLIHLMLQSSLLGFGSLLNSPEFFEELCSLARSSRLIGLLQKEVMAYVKQFLLTRFSGMSITG